VRVRAAILLFALTGCEGMLPPLRKVGEVGRDPIVVFVGGEEDRSGDLFAAPAAGGEVAQLTYSSVGEARPALAPDGGAVAFLRTPGSVWVMNLINGVDREVRLPEGAGTPTRVGWAADGRSLVVATETGLYRAPAPPAEGEAVAIPAAGRVAAESSLAVLLGSPAFARVVACERPTDLCVVGDTGAPALIAAGSRDAARWGRDSVAYFTGDELVVRPLGPGRDRKVQLENVPPRPRQPTVFAGSPSSSP
jgi:hypothetical protein